MDGDFYSEVVTITGSITDAADLDGDGDIDVLSASYADDRIVWYENLRL